ncbi:MAG: S1 RNA-binding domain-containing protein [Acidobacteriota bacterium]
MPEQPQPENSTDVEEKDAAAEEAAPAENLAAAEDAAEVSDSAAEAAAEEAPAGAEDPAPEEAVAEDEAAAEVETEQAAAEQVAEAEAQAESADAVAAPAGEAAPDAVQEAGEVQAGEVQAAASEEEAPAQEAAVDAAAASAESSAQDAEPKAQAEETQAEGVQEAEAQPVETQAAEEEAAEAQTAAEPEANAPDAAAAAEDREAGAADGEAQNAEAQNAEAQEVAAADGEAAQGEDDSQKPAGGLEDENMRELVAAKEAKLSVAGKVIGWNKGGYHVAIGKVAAFCPVSQIEIGNPRSPKKYLDKDFDFRIIEIQDSGRRVVVSRAAALKAKRAEEAAKIREVLKAGAVLDGRVSSITDFGAFVNLGGGIEGLVHVSEISRQRVEHAKEVLNVGKKVKVQVLKVEKGGKRISLSMKRLEADPWDGVQERFQPGGEFKGTITRSTEFGLFVEVEPGLEGLIHTSRFPLGASADDDALKVGSEITGWVHEVERKRRRLSLSLRPVAEGNPWKDVGERFPEGDIVEGKVERLAKFGVFVELEPGLTGLLPFAVLGGGISNPKRQFQIGKEIKVKVLSVDPSRKRISLGTEASKAEGSDQDYKNYMKSQRKAESDSGLGALAQAFAKFQQQNTP